MLRFATVALGSLAFGVVAVAGFATADDKSDWKKIMPGPELVQLVEESTKLLQDATKSASQFNMKAKTAEREAYAVAIYAQVGIHGGDADIAKKSSALRDAALALAEAAKKKDFEEAKKHVAAIASFKTASPGAAKENVSLKDSVPIEDLMENVNTVNKEFLKYKRLAGPAWNAKGKPEEIALNSRRMAALTVAIDAHAPDKDEAKKTKKAWADSVKGVQIATLEMVEAAKSKKAAEWKEAYNRMDASCTRCHEVFRDE